MFHARQIGRFRGRLYEQLPKKSLLIELMRGIWAVLTGNKRKGR